MESSHPPFPFDQQCLVALKRLSAVDESRRAAGGAFEPTSAGFALSWQMLADFASSGSHSRLDARGRDLVHRRPRARPAAAALRALLHSARHRRPRACDAGGRVDAVGTTAVRALEHAASTTGAVRAGFGVATQRAGPSSRLRAVDVVLSGMHGPGTSHYDLLSAFAPERTLALAGAELAARG